MNLIDKVILEWSYRTKKGYPDLNNEEDLKVFESLFGFNLKESPLTPKELGKQNSKTKEERIEILIYKIKNKEPLELDGGGTFIVHDPTGSKIAELQDWTPAKGPVTLEDKDGNTITTSKLKKSADFGGGKGSGGGAAQTSIQESGQCLVNALVQKYGNDITTEDLTPEKLNSVKEDVDINISVNSVIDFIINSPGWSNTFINTAKKLLNYTGDGFEFHRGSSYVDSIYSSWRKVRKSNDWRIQDDKWNPADIWIVSPIAKNIKLNDNSIEELNNHLLELFEEKKLIGVSLKKLGPDSKLTVLNREKVSEKDDYSSSTVSPTSKDAYTNFKSGATMQLRTFSTDGTSFQGELKGKTAAQGKIGGGVLAMFLKKNGLEEIPSQKNALTDSVNLSDSFVNYFIELASKHGDFKITEEELKEKSTDWISSKYQALSVIKVLETGDKEKVSNALTDIVNYAGSRSSISSVYIKVS
jgi:hypothetical protein